VAHDLNQQGVRVGEPVILVTAHGTRNVVALLAVLKAGGCYVPMDQGTWSSERIEYVLNIVTDSRFVVNTTHTQFRSDKHTVIDLRAVPCTRQTLSRQARTDILPSSPACIIFTSGSTGKPKGTVQTHEAIANYASTKPFNMDVHPNDRVLHILSVAFDGRSVRVIMLNLL
jgi:non-ribosomal peptide synthetase component F